MTKNTDLFEDDLDRTRQSALEADEWNERYRGTDQLFSGRPNGSLEVELGDQAPGRVLDIGCGEGADAIWLAANGWTVTATDISANAIDRAHVAATAVGVSVDFHASDTITDPPQSNAYDVVTISYPALKRASGFGAMRAIASAVSVGGDLVVIGHAEIDREQALEHGFDPDDYLSIDDIAATVADTFTITVDEVRDRPNPPADAHHLRDRVFRATRVR